MGDALDLGLFPLRLVLLPGERVALHLFEPRYRQLYADCVLEQRPFAIVQATATGTVAVGCSARFETLVRRYEDGRLDVVAVGLEPVEVLDETEGHLYFSARVRALDDLPVAPDRERAEEVLRRYRALAGAGEEAVPDAPPETPLSYAVASSFALPPDAKQRLLESRDEGERLGLVLEILGAAETELRHARLAAERAVGNGRVSAP